MILIQLAGPRVVSIIYNARSCTKEPIFSGSKKDYYNKIVSKTFMSLDSSIITTFVNSRTYIFVLKDINNN